MQVNPTVGVLYAQMNYASRAASDAATGPEASLAMSRVLAQEMAKLEQDQVQALESSTETKITDDDITEREKQKNFSQEERSRTPQDEEDMVNISSDSLVGNLINMKI